MLITIETTLSFVFAGVALGALLTVGAVLVYLNHLGHKPLAIAPIKRQAVPSTFNPYIKARKTTR